jgi:hypothetical protein
LSHSLPYKFLTNSSGLFSVILSILIVVKSTTATVKEGTMSLTVFLALCILGLDFMVYALFQWIYGEKRRAFAHQVAARKRVRKEQAPSLLPAATRMAALHLSRPAPATLTSQRAGGNPPIAFRPNMYTSRTA